MTSDFDPATTALPTREISRGMISIYKDHTDRGPAAARTTIGDDYAVTMLETSLTKAERTLVATGDGDVVREVRRKFQMAMAEEICELVERVTGRPTKALLSDHDVTLDLAVEVVVFADAGPGSESSAAANGGGPEADGDGNR